MLTKYTYDGWNLAEEKNASNAVLASYVYGAGLDTLLQMRRGLTDSYYHADDQGSVLALTNGSGAVVERYAYGDYGLPTVYNGAGTTALSGTAVGNPFLYTGRQWDPETGLYYYRHRYLDPRAGRFITSDPLGLYGDPSNVGNPYAYVGGSPWGFVDPVGLARVDPVNDNQAWRKQYEGGGTPRAGDWAIEAHAVEPFAQQVREGVEMGAAFYDGIALGADWSDGYDPCDRKNQWAHWFGEQLSIAALMTLAGPFAEAALGKLMGTALTPALRAARSLMDDLGIGAGAGPVLASAGKLPLTGVSRFDELAVGTANYARWASNVQTRGYTIEFTALDQGTAAQIIGNRIVIDSGQFRYVDLLHKSRHIAQRANAQGVSVANRHAVAVLERGAYEYEIRLGQRAGFSQQYLDWAQSRIQSIWTQGTAIKYPLSQRLQNLWR